MNKNKRRKGVLDQWNSTSKGSQVRFSGSWEDTEWTSLVSAGTDEVDKIRKRQVTEVMLSLRCLVESKILSKELMYKDMFMKESY